MSELPGQSDELKEYVVSVRVVAPDKQTAFSALGVIIRTDATMFTVQQEASMAGVRVDWESLHAEPAPAPAATGVMAYKAM